MTRRSKIIIAVVIIFFLVLLAMLFLLKPPSAAPAPSPAANSNVNKGSSLNVTTNPRGNINIGTSGTNAQAAPAQADEKTGLKNTARSFAELFGSFSTEGNFQNIVDSEYYMTASVKAWAETNVVEMRAKPRTGEFSGTTTRAIFEPVVTAYDKAAGTATVTVKTRRIETGATIGNQNVYYQDLTLEFVKVGDGWKVNRFTWGAK